MTALDLANLLKDYGPWGLLALALLTIRFLFNGWRDCMVARIEERGQMATALERQASGNAATSAALDDVREGQIEIAKLAAEALKGDEGNREITKDALKDIKSRLDVLAGRGGA
ncbi:hypothetical protein [Methylobacterium sp. J-092]|uniref:hypothetical protein n=1 Tax=Methylobacterium sp. J-092 TaxID=2836667 RepID=UPI001FBA6D4A|nr:hypothetical protein [Methylobacterium sp. J-092]MCJ2009819.1 hypothetical protein [Methylobacterium sp. J-092]